VLVTLNNSSLGQAKEPIVRSIGRLIQATKRLFALAPVADLPVQEIVSAIHIVANLTLGLGRVVHDYLRQPTPQLVPIGEMSLAT
jgi:hypothetical protein